ncbi:hypothetical protein CL659_00880 [bacterium]|nr:hypothetical protein [bacterium]|tara:strand:+ start:982 stop:2199 length:1218 start_codon:yes stop_codon:yes gene_type:complete
MFLFNILPIFSDDAYLTAYFADSFVGGSGFPNSDTVTLLGITDPLYLYFVSFLVYVGLTPLTAIHLVNSLSIFLIFAIIKKEKGTSIFFIVLAFISLWYQLLVGNGNGLFMLFFLLYLIDYKKLEPIWLSLATSVRFDFGLYLAYVFIGKLKEKDFQWCLKAFFSFVPVLMLNLFFWKTPIPNTLLSKRLMYDRLFMLDFEVPDHLQWLILSICFALLFKKINKKVILAALAFSLSWAFAGVSPGNAFSMLGFMLLLAFVFSSHQDFIALLKKQMFKICLIACALTLPQTIRIYQKWEDHHYVTSEISKLMPEQGCTLVYWYFGYLRHHSDACLVDGSGFFDKNSFELLSETKSNEIFLRLSEKPSSVIHFHQPDVEPLRYLPEYPFSRIIKGKYIQAIIYTKDF